MNVKILSTLFCCAAALTSGAASAQDFPVRPIQVIVPYSAGGGTDIAARRIAEALQRLNPGSTMVVRNQTGGGGSIGTSAAVNARPDGYTLGTGSQGPMALLPHYGGIDYTIDDIEFIGLMGRNPIVGVACAGSPFDTDDAFFS